MQIMPTHHHLAGHNLSDSDFSILTSGNPKFDLKMRESFLTVSKLKPILNTWLSCKCLVKYEVGICSTSYCKYINESLTMYEQVCHNALGTLLI